MNTIVLKSSEWFRGIPEGSSLFVARENKYCCLGICGREIFGIPNDEMVGLALPKDMKERFGFRAVWAQKISPQTAKEMVYVAEGNVVLDRLFTKTRPNQPWEDVLTEYSLESAAVIINDAYFLTDTRRLAMLRPLFRQAGFELEFRSEE